MPKAEIRCFCNFILMKHLFKAAIYKASINACVDVPAKITAKMVATKGYIAVKGTINKHPFTQTLVPVKNGPYRLFVNGSMLKLCAASPGDMVSFNIEQDMAPKPVLMPAALKKALNEHKLLADFNAFSASRKKEVFRYLGNLKTRESVQKNIEKVIAQLQKKKNDGRGFLRSLHTPG
jgi:hypothetical protein